ncbi:MAG: DNA-binding protein [Clostridia bacterium]|nr:DNA-binding protein [Clostridia bacterium]
MDKFSFISLWDVYGGLLTAVQRDITDLYFNKDLTVSEIAEQKQISRQAVSDCLKSCKKQLEEYEEKLHAVKKLKEISSEISSTLTKAGVWAEEFKTAHPEFTEEILKLQNILN